MSKVTVVILTKNPGSIFRRVLDSVRAQKTTFDFDVLVVDSGSVDGTLEYLASLNDQRLRTLSIRPEDFGHGKTRNWAVEKSTGEYVAMLTHDATPASEQWLEELLAVAERHPKIAGVFGRHIAYESANPFTAYELDLHFQGFQNSEVYSLEDPERYKREQGYRQFLHFFSDNNSLIRRSVWRDIPYPDVNFAEDQIWAKKIIEAGWQKGYAHKAVVMHSHDYTLWERLQRSFDESYAFLCLFGYRNTGSWKSVVKTWLGLCRRDLKFAVKNSVAIRFPIATLRMPVDNLMRVLGGFLGAKGDRLNPKIQGFLSRDRRVALGLLQASKPGQVQNG
jgi:rhamnosyltransferase